MLHSTAILSALLAGLSLSPPIDAGSPAQSPSVVRVGQTTARSRLAELLRDCRLARNGVEFDARLHRTSAPTLEWGRARVTRLPGVLLIAERTTELSPDPVDFVRIDGVRGKRFAFDGSVEVSGAHTGAGSGLESWLPLALQDGSMLEAPDEVRTLEESLEQWSVEMSGVDAGIAPNARLVGFILRPLNRPMGLELTLEFEASPSATRIRRLAASTRRSDAPETVVPIHDTIAHFDSAAAAYPVRLEISVVRPGSDGVPVTQRHVLEIENATALKLDRGEARQRAEMMLEPALGAVVIDQRFGLRYRGGDRRFDCGGRAYLAERPLGSPIAIRFTELLETSTPLDIDGSQGGDEKSRPVDEHRTPERHSTNSLN